MNIGVSRDMQSTNYTIKKQIQNTATVNWSEPSAVIQVILNIALSFEIVGLNVRPFCTDFVQSEQKSTNGQLFSLTNPRSASIQTSQSVTTLELLPSAKQMT